MHTASNRMFVIAMNFITTTPLADMYGETDRTCKIDEYTQN